MPRGMRTDSAAAGSPTPEDFDFLLAARANG
jgi:hypothetical protein